MRKLAPCGWQVSGHDRVCRCRRRAYLAAGRVVSADPGPAESLADQRVFWLYGPLFGLIMMLGLGGFVRVARRDGWRISIQRRRDGPSMMPWVAAVVLLVTPIAIADFDCRYLLPVVPFACLAAGLAFAAPAISSDATGRGAVQAHPGPAGRAEGGDRRRRGHVSQATLAS
jgi:hypothetical protein